MQEDIISLKRIIIELSKKIEEQENRISELEAENRALKKENIELQEKLGINSKNSSLPSSKEIYKHKKLKKRASGKKKGGQLGHKGYHRELEKEDEKIEVELEEKICECGGEYNIYIKNEIHQKIDIDEIKPHVINYELKKYRCNKCGKKRKANLPKGVSKETFGNNIGIIISSLTAFYKNSRRDVQNILQDIFNIKISLGSISNKEKKISEKCQEAYEDIELKIQQFEI